MTLGNRIQSTARRSTFCLIWIAVSCTALQTVRADDGSVAFDNETRCWRDTSGEYEFNAALIRYHNRQVTLRAEDGKTIDVPLDNLSTPDRVYLARQRRLARKRSSIRGDELPDRRDLASLNNPADAAAPVTKQNRGGPPEQLFGVDWYSMDTAQEIAQSENKPVMWFRVLGDLSGFM
jgi:hypothetical protein